LQKIIEIGKGVIIIVYKNADINIIGN